MVQEVPLCVSAYVIPETFRRPFREGRAEFADTDDRVGDGGPFRVMLSEGGGVAGGGVGPDSVYSISVTEPTMTLTPRSWASLTIDIVN